jgi:hypothetical protein
MMLGIAIVFIDTIIYYSYILPPQVVRRIEEVMVSLNIMFDIFHRESIIKPVVGYAKQ